MSHADVEAEWSGMMPNATTAENGAGGISDQEDERKKAPGKHPRK